MIAIALPFGNNPYDPSLELPFASNENCSNEYNPKVLLHDLSLLLPKLPRLTIRRGEFLT